MNKVLVTTVFIVAGGILFGAAVFSPNYKGRLFAASVGCFAISAKAYGLF